MANMQADCIFEKFFEIFLRWGNHALNNISHRKIWLDFKGLSLPFACLLGKIEQVDMCLANRLERSLRELWLKSICPKFVWNLYKI